MLSFKTITVASSLLSLTQAFDSITVPSTIAADTDFKLTLVNDISTGSSSFDAQFANFRVYLSDTPPGWGSGPVCYLVNSTAIATTSLTLQIPASVGPSDSSSPGYTISVMEFNPPGEDGPSGFEYSNNFAFTGGTGVWSEYETSGYGIGDADNIPCTAYGCARNCSQTYYPENTLDTEDSPDCQSFNAALAAAKSTYECVAACPGVTYESLEDITSGGDGEEYGSCTSGVQSSTSSQSGSATKSATTTQSSTLKTASTSATGTAASTKTSSSTASATSSATTATSTTSDSNIQSVALKWAFAGVFAQLVWGI